MILWRSLSNWLIRSCRRKASRAISLRFFPDRRLALVKSSSRSLSSLIVRVLIFMSYNVRRRPKLVNRKMLLLTRDTRKKANGHQTHSITFCIEWVTCFLPSPCMHFSCWAATKISLYRKQSVLWSFTMPTACINA